MAQWKKFGVLTVAANILLATACAGPEEDLVNRFLAASQSGDNQIVAGVSMVAFPEDVASWKILEVVDLPNGEYLVPRFRQDVEEAEDQRNAQWGTLGNFRKQHYEDLVRIENRTEDDPEYRFPGRLGELQEGWDRQQQDLSDARSRLNETKIDLEREIRQVTKSLFRESSPEYLTGEVLKRAVLVRVTTATSEKTYRITLSRYELKNQFDAVVPARFLITDLGEEEP